MNTLRCLVCTQAECGPRLLVTL